MEYTGYKTVEFSDKELAVFYEDKKLNFHLLENEYLLIKDSENQLVDKYVLQDNRLRRVKYTKFDNAFTGSIKPRNPEQEILFDMLADPYEMNDIKDMPENAALIEKLTALLKAELA